MCCRHLLFNNNQAKICESNNNHPSYNFSFEARESIRKPLFTAIVVTLQTIGEGENIFINGNNFSFLPVFKVLHLLP